MVSHNPLFRGRWTAKRFQATVINDIWPEVLLFTLIATMVSAVSKLTPHKLVISSTLLTVLGTVLGLVISFRTSSAYERYQEGRKQWSNIAVASNNLATLFWIHTPAKRDIPGASEEEIRLRIHAFSVAVKHFLRSEPGVYYQDLYPLICFLPRYANGGASSLDDKLPLWSSSDDYEEVHKNRKHTNSNPRSAADALNHHQPQRTESLPTDSQDGSLTEDNKSQTSWFRSFKRNSNGHSRSRPNSFDPEKVLPEVDSHHPLKPSRNPPSTSLYDYIPLFRFFAWCGRVLRNKKLTEYEMEQRLKRKKLDQVESNVPLEICLVLSGYAASLMQAGLLQPATSVGMVSSIFSLQDTLSNLERIRNTPLPFAYQAHLRMSLWLYLLFLPFQIFSFFGWWTIPGTTFASFLLLGFLEIGQEIENPFNYDLNDLDLDHFCLAIQRGLHEITAVCFSTFLHAIISYQPHQQGEITPSFKQLVYLRASCLHSVKQSSMVSHNPLFHGKWTAKRFQATVINDIWPEVLLFTLIATMVSAVSKLTPHKLVISNTLLTVLGTVLGLVISFRTSSAYERYQDGRKMWTNIAVVSKNLATLVTLFIFWIHTPAKRNIPDASEEEIKLRVIMEKKTMINLIQAFSVSVKHFLRSEPGVYYQDLYPLICFLPRYANGGAPSLDDKLPLWSSSDDYEEVHKHRNHTHSNPRSAADTPNHHHPQRTESLPTHSHNGSVVEDNKSQTSWFRSFKRNSNGHSRSRRSSFDPEKVLPEVDSHHPLKPSRNPPPTSVSDYIPLFRFFTWCGRVLRNKRLTEHEMEQRLKRKKLDQVESNVPLEICLVLSGYAAFLMQAGLLQPAIATGMVNSISSLQDTLSNLERIRNTPLPFAYQAHLRMSLWLYLLFLPFQIFSFFGWWTIPGTAFTSFLLLGFLEIGQEIENPFNYDLNDLDLDHFCLALQRELHEVTAYTVPDIPSFVFSQWNHPFAPADRRNAAEIIKHESYTIPHDKNAPEPGMESIRRTLVKSWREVDSTTRHT
ncbi:hypothetical protein C0993_011891 [Termitomyces sp. T159_Od127]|nr:hypothetical protein C0993_011891 [Termitomyces sp. T159_Od127]